MSDTNPFKDELRHIEKSGELAKYRARLKLMSAEREWENSRSHYRSVNGNIKMAFLKRCAWRRWFFRT